MEGIHFLKYMYKILDIAISLHGGTKVKKIKTEPINYDICIYMPNTTFY